MRQVEIRGYGGAEQLVVAFAAEPEPAADEVKIRVRSAGVAFGDVLMRTMSLPGVPRPPIVPGYDVAGVVERVGSNVSSVAVGARVAARVGRGGYAQFVCAPADGVVTIPDGVGDVEAVACTLNYTTAHQLLHRAGRVQKGQRILVPSAAGGVGTALLQLAKLGGIHALGVVSPQKRDWVESLGATAINDASLETQHVDVGFESNGGRHLWRTRAAVRRGGTLVVFGVSAAVGRDGRRHPSVLVGTMASLAMMKLMPGRTLFYGSDDEFAKRRAQFVSDSAVVLDLTRTKAIVPLIAAVMPLEEAAAAHRLLESGAAVGKIVLSLEG